MVNRKRKSYISNNNNNSFNTRLQNFETAIESNERRVGKYRGVSRNLPALVPGRGMMCTRAGYTRYLNEIQKFFENTRFMGRRINTVVYQYYGDMNMGFVLDRPSSVINNKPKLITNSSLPIQKINNNPTGVYYFMVFAMNNSTDRLGHAISVLVDPNPSFPRLWVFDPHGSASMINSGDRFGKITRDKIVPNIKKMFGDVFQTNNTRTVYYNGPDLQARNNRGVCTTFYVSFAEQIMNLLNNSISLNQLGFIIPNNPEGRKLFLNRPPNPNRNVVERVPTVTNKPLGANRLYMTMGRSNSNSNSNRNNNRMRA